MRDSVKRLIKLGVEARESGDSKKAILFFKHALDQSDNTVIRAEIVGQMGYCHQLLGNLQQAAVLYEASLDDFCLHGDIVGVARMRKQISSLMILKGMPDEAFDLALKARNVVVTSGITPTDLYSLTYGVVNALHAKRKTAGLVKWFYYSKEIMKWTFVEYREAWFVFRKKYGRPKAIGRLIDLNRTAASV